MESLSNDSLSNKLDDNISISLYKNSESVSESVSIPIADSDVAVIKQDDDNGTSSFVDDDDDVVVDDDAGSVPSSVLKL